MPIRNTHRPGDWLYACQRCGLTKYASQVRLEWTGLRVCSDCWDPRHPQEFVRGRVDDIVPPYTNPPGVTFITTSNRNGTDELLSPSGDDVISPSGDNVLF
jgi:hypothetical protein